jgi:hypothetical protein
MSICRCVVSLGSFRHGRHGIACPGSERYRGSSRTRIDRRSLPRHSVFNKTGGEAGIGDDVSRYLRKQLVQGRLRPVRQRGPLLLLSGSARGEA